MIFSTFTFADREYRVPAGAVRAKQRIRLPDGTVLRAIVRDPPPRRFGNVGVLQSPDIDVVTDGIDEPVAVTIPRAEPISDARPLDDGVEPPISFEFEGKRYVVDTTAYDLGYAELPGGRFIAFRGWFESLPPQPGSVLLTNRDEAYAPVAARPA